MSQEQPEMESNKKKDQPRRGSDGNSEQSREIEKEQPDRGSNKKEELPRRGSG